MIQSTKPPNLDVIQLERDLAKFVKDKVGKGPNKIEVKLVDNIAVCVFYGFMTKAEESIAKSGQPWIVNHFRSTYPKSNINELNAIFESALNKRIKRLFLNCSPEDNISCWTIFLD